MRVSATLSIYIGRQFLVGIAVVFALLVLLAYSFDLIELLRRASGRNDATFGIVIEMSLLKLPALALKLLPFSALFGAMLALTRMTRNHELVVARASGVSVWQFLMPGLVLAALIGALVITVFEPVAAAMVSRYEMVEAKYLHGRTSLLAVSENGLWLREADATGQSVVHALRMSQKGTELSDVIIFLYGGKDRFVGRVDAQTARLENGEWNLDQALLTGPDRPAQFFDRFRLKTSLTLDQIQDSFASPESMSFWDLPRFIETTENAGFSAHRHRLYFNQLLSLPLLLLAMVLIAATFSLRLTRRGGTGVLFACGGAAGFLLYFVSDIVFTLGTSGTIPVPMAAWIPAGVCTLLGLTTLMHLEDG
ncbi:MAG TPA: LPS export ABC transporter permease LptG [Candidatus Cybelea sp.]|nr:LPS export ABC transporter permease LptG [Candidatus Cybelea sp.]